MSFTKEESWPKQFLAPLGEWECSDGAMFYDSRLAKSYQRGLDSKSNLTEIHDSATCKLGEDGQPCSTCKWANESVKASPLDDPSVRREYDTWNLETELDRYRNTYGNDALAEQIENFMTERGLY